MGLAGHVTWGQSYRPLYPKAGAALCPFKEAVAKSRSGEEAGHPPSPHWASGASVLWGSVIYSDFGSYWTLCWLADKAGILSPPLY